MDDRERFERNRRLVRERLDRELERGTGYVEDRLADLVSGPAGLLVNPAAKLIYRWIGEKAVKRRTRRQLEIVADLAGELDERSPEELVDRELDALLETEELGARGRRSHPRFDEVRDTIRDLLVQRLRIIGTLLRQGRGESYPEVVRSVYDRDDVEPVTRDHFRRTRELLDLVQSEPSLLPVPPGFRDPLWTLVGDTVDWYEDRLETQFDAIFGPAAGADAADRRASSAGGT